ncbi:MAG: hypothetical protein KY445_09925 [Armatimonadetes bacterium]|nr:hypothetical protein [Armatimonadota bacterium]
MKRKLVLRPVAGNEIAAAASEYSLRDARRGQQFLSEIQESLRFIEENARACAIRSNGMRRPNLINFPRALIYLVVEDFDAEWNETVEKLVVLGCIHHRQDDAPLTKRLDPQS